MNERSARTEKHRFCSSTRQRNVEKDGSESSCAPRHDSSEPRCRMIHRPIMPRQDNHNLLMFECIMYTCTRSNRTTRSIVYSKFQYRKSSCNKSRRRSSVASPTRQESQNPPSSSFAFSLREIHGPLPNFHFTNTSIQIHHAFNQAKY